MDWKAIWLRIKNIVRCFVSRYNAELKKYSNDFIDAKLLELQTAVSDEVRRKIKNEVLAYAIEQQIDIYTSAGADILKEIINEYIDKLSQKGE